MKARSNKNEALLTAMDGVLADLTPLQLNSEFCRALAYSKLPRSLLVQISHGDYDTEAWKRQRDKRDAYKKRREAENCAIRKAP